MHIRIRHDTHYRYERPTRGFIQALRLTPRDYDGQHVLRWRVEPSVPGLMRVREDGLGNIVHVFSPDGPATEIAIRVAGEVDTHETHGVVRNAVERMPDTYYLRHSELAAADEAIAAFADEVAHGADGLARLHRLLAAIHGRVAFEIGPTGVTTTAAEAFALGRGVCQDLTHVFIAAARHIGVPARYVSGYLKRADGVVEQEAGHAWAEAKVEGLGWIGFDAANGISTTEAHVRVAIGVDYLGAAPVRGSRYGGGGEAIDVSLTVERAERQARFPVQA